MWCGILPTAMSQYYHQHPETSSHSQTVGLAILKYFASDNNNINNNNNTIKQFYKSQLKKTYAFGFQLKKALCEMQTCVIKHGLISILYPDLYFANAKQKINRNTESGHRQKQTKHDLGSFNA